MVIEDVITLKTQIREYYLVHLIENKYINHLSTRLFLLLEKCALGEHLWSQSYIFIRRCDVSLCAMCWTVLVIDNKIVKCPNIASYRSDVHVSVCVIWSSHCCGQYFDMMWSDNVSKSLEPCDWRRGATWQWQHRLGQHW